MANLYDKIRKKKKENLENLYLNLQQNHPTSMGEAIAPPAKFTDLIGKSSGQYAGGNAAQTIKKPSTPKEINDAVEKKNEGECVNGIWVGGDNEGEPCQQSDESDEKDALNEKVNSIAAGTRTDDEGELINPDAKDDPGFLGRKEGGTVVGNALRNAVSLFKGVVGKEGSAHIMDAAPFGDPVAKQGTYGKHVNQGAYDNINILTDNAGNQSQGGTSDTFQLPDGTVIKTDYNKGTKGTPKVDAEAKVTYEEAYKDADKEKYPTLEKFIEAAELDPLHGTTGSPAKPAVPGTPSSITSSVIPGTEEEIPGESSTNLEFGTQLRTNWGQNLLDQRTQNREKKELKHNKKDFTGNQKDLFKEAKKSLRLSKNLPGSKDAQLRAIYNEMDRLNAKRDSKTQLEGTFGGQRSIYDIAQGIKDGTGDTYKELVESGEYSDADLKGIRNLADYQSDTGQGIEFQRPDKETLPPEYTNTLNEEQLNLVKHAKTQAEAEAILKKYYDREKPVNEITKQSVKEFNIKPEAANQVDLPQGDSSVYNKPAFKKQSSIFKMKRGRLLPPGK